MQNIQKVNDYNLSIIIPHYNSSVMLEKLLSTIPKDKAIEVIVIDDKSEEKHIGHIDQTIASKKYVDFLFLKNETAGKGAGVARNIGLEHARGEWVLFADSDDYFTENFYESVSRYFTSDNEVVFFKPTSIYIDTGEVADRHNNFVNMLEKYQSDPSTKNELNLRYNIPNPICKMIKRSFLIENEILFDGVIASNDVMFSTKVGYFMQMFAISEETIYVITRNHGSLTVNMSEKVFDARLSAKIDYYHFLKARLSLDELRMLDICFTGWLVSSLKYGIKNFFDTYKLLKRHNLKILNSKIVNPIFVTQKIFRRMIFIKNSKKYRFKD